MELANRELDSLSTSRKSELDHICYSIDDISRRLEKL
jgi:hypothetical protein